MGIHQEITLPGNPKAVFAALTDAKKFSAFTGGAPAEIAAKPGGAFSCFGGRISGRIVELMPDVRIVQAWRAGNWPEGVFSIARFELKPKSTGTLLTFDHTGYPEDQAKHLESGWNAMYWDPLRKYLA